MPRKRGAHRGRVSLIDSDTGIEDQQAEHDDVSSQHNYSVGWVDDRNPQSPDGILIVPTISSSCRTEKKKEEFQVAGVRLPIKINKNQ